MVLGIGYSGGETGKEDPIDQIDKAFKKHDYRWGKGQIERGDRELYDKLRKLPQDPRDWNPPAPNPLDAEKYRRWAEEYFKKTVEGWDKKREEEKNKSK